ncbi:unnamed protein product [Rhizoctonia solani]|uniref:Uncharacterized protein n=1 Tax=Rhizoctonia solani TaxID=456999 RepID=A0A8H3C351_9AGAM|nr:unnamed protein product [Rhizoctonia solani]
MDSRCPSPVELDDSDLEPHELWGKHRRPFEFLMEYKKLFSEHIGVWEPKGIEELDRCIRMLRENKDKVSVSELETMVRSALTWQLFEHFTRDSLDLIPHFMELLRSYCEENWLFDRYYGFLCFQLLTYVMIAGIINNFDEREHAFNEIRRRSIGSLDIARNIAGCSAAMPLGEVQSHPGYFEERLSTLFVTSYLEGECVLLPGLGGFREKDALWLLDELWEVRKSFLPLCAGIFGMLPGWVVLFTALWRCVKRTDSAVLLKKLRNLLLRYSLATIEPELGVVCVIVSKIEEQIPSSAIGNEELRPVDVQDVGFMIRLFQAYLKSEKHHRSPGDMLCFSFAMVYHNALTAAPNQASPLLVAVTK